MDLFLTELDNYVNLLSTSFNIHQLYQITQDDQIIKIIPNDLSVSQLTTSIIENNLSSQFTENIKYILNNTLNNKTVDVNLDIYIITIKINNQTKVLIFKVHPTGKEVVNRHKIFNQYTPDTEIYSINWDKNTSEELSNTLIYQIKNTLHDLIVLNQYCGNPDTYNCDVAIIEDIPQELQVTTSNMYINLSYEEKIKLCKSYNEKAYSYYEILLDDNLIYKFPELVETYAIIIISNDIYYGHVYTWISPINPDYCFIQGIRNIPESSFDKNSVKNISKYLLDGARQFALNKGCKKIVVTHPMKVMKGILIHLGFVNEYVTSDEVGLSLGNNRLNVKFGGTCNTCYGYSDLSTPFILGHDVKIFN